MATSTTALELQDIRTTVVQRETAHSADHEHVNVDPLLRASQVADSDVPEGGYGWVVVAACAVLSWWVIGTSYSWGVIQGALVEEGLSTPAVLSFVGALGPTMLASTAIFNSRIIRLLGLRNAGLVGISLIGFAEILSSFAVKSVPGLFVTEGVVLGFGFGLCFMITSSTPAQYSARNEDWQMVLSLLEEDSVVQAILSVALDPLIRNIGAAWTFRVLGLATIASGLPAAWFIKERTIMPRPAIVEWRLFKDPNFVLVFIAGAIGTFPLLVPPFFIPLYAHAIGLSSGVGAGLLAGFNFSSALGRIICGLLCDVIGPLNALFLSLLLSAVSMLAVWPASSTLPPLAVFVIVNGLANGGFFSTMPTVVGNVFGSARVTGAMSMIVTSWAGGYLLGAPIAGYLLDAYGGESAGFKAYRPAMFYAGSLALGASGFVELVRLRRSSNFFAKL
ncbi:MFS general substrate transporter [Biscogniauxia marginata]|nr:MFS general substrate transporter [Biscogniauxia marginata]